MLHNSPIQNMFPLRSQPRRRRHNTSPKLNVVTTAVSVSCECKCAILQEQVQRACQLYRNLFPLAQVVNHLPAQALNDKTLLPDAGLDALGWPHEDAESLRTTKAVCLSDLRRTRLPSVSAAAAHALPTRFHSPLVKLAQKDLLRGDLLQGRMGFDPTTSYPSPTLVFSFEAPRASKSVTQLNWSDKGTT